MSTQATIDGGSQLKWNFTGSIADNPSSVVFSKTFSGPVEAFWGTGSALQTPAVSNYDMLAILSGEATSIPGSYNAVLDNSTNDTVVGGAGDATYFIQNNTRLQLSGGSASNLVYAAGKDTIAAGAGADTIYAGSNGATVLGGNGNLTFVGGTGSVSLSGGTGTLSALGSTGKGSTFLQAAAGNSTLNAGTGAGASTLIGGTNTTEFARGSGDKTFIAGTGHSLINGTTGTGNEIIFTSPISQTGTALIGLNNAADTVIAGTGSATIVGGTGPDVYGIVNGHSGGSITILGFKDTDNLAFGNYTGNPIASEAVHGASDVITLSDGTTITLVGVYHKLFS